MKDDRPSQSFLDFHRHLLKDMETGFIAGDLIHELGEAAKMSEEPPIEPLVHFDAAKIIIGPLSEGKAADTPTISYPYHRVRVITVNGEIWDKLFDPWGLTETTVRANWDTRNLETWTQYKP